MPYIPQGERVRSLTEPRTVGELNFCLTAFIDLHVRTEGLSYTTINAVLGSLECVRAMVVDQYRSQHGSKLTMDLFLFVNTYLGTNEDKLGALRGAELEFYRRVAGPYEDGAIVRNGDVYASELTTRRGAVPREDAS